MLRKIDHLVLTTAHLADCLAFYNALGFRSVDAGDHWELFSGDFKLNVHLKGHELEPKARNVQTGSADLCFELDIPLAACRDALIACGIQPETDIVTRHGARGSMHSFYLRDPDENLIELCCYVP
ncbi:MAG: VOC family protein [Pygmaiobacter sp.]